MPPKRMDLGEHDTIVAQATPVGFAGIGVVRVSGSLCTQIAKTMLGHLPPARVATYSDFNDHTGLNCDQGIALFFKAPHSFTGEDVLELQGHGGPVVMEHLIQSILNMGARLAKPGEFTLRAFLNQKIDLTQAEAVADLIHASSTTAARAALCSLQGAFSRAVQSIADQLIEQRLYVEAMIDFAEEDIQNLDTFALLARLTNLQSALEQLLEKTNQGVKIQQGARLLIMGLPNAGKSSLLNCLSEKEHAIVTHIPGTTRDIVRTSFVLEGHLIELIDTAGLRLTEDPIEQEGIRRALEELKMAEHVIWMIDAAHDLTKNFEDLYEPWRPYFKPDTRITVVYNKIDLLREKPALPPNPTVFYVSIKTGEGLDRLRQHLKQLLGLTANAESVFSARTRHVEGLLAARQAIDFAIQQFKDNGALELLADNLRHAQQALEAITGRFSSDDLLGKIFSTFCIGK